MHEMSVVRNIIEIIQEHVPAGDENKVRKVGLKVGALAGIVPDSLVFCFDVMKEEMAFKNAELDIEHVPITARCKICVSESVIEYGIFRCPVCGGTDIEIIGGNELNVTGIEIDD